MGMLSDSSDLEADAPGSVQPRISEEMQDVVMSSDAEGPSFYFPPPRVAARFYKSSNSRRKSSATSSRRNSMSSHHSSRSARSAHGGPQSTHIAQHLRRASILENRKARLADKAAHAEEVRLRAAMAKAAPRGSTTSELRAAAAEQARNRHLAQVAAQCAEEVQRAKRVAEDTREKKAKKAAEHLKLKGDMEGKLAEAERRRLLYLQTQRRARTATLPSAEEKKVMPGSWKPRNEEEAARLIQKAWQNRRRRQILHEFIELDLTVEKIRESSFEGVGALLSQENILACTSKMLKLCGLQDKEGGGVGERTAVRIFLSTFLILGHPAQVLSTDGVQEQDLIAKAENLLLSFESILSRTSEQQRFSPLTSQLATLAESYSSFQNAFFAWKDHDSSVLIQSMVAQFAELDAIWQSVQNDANGDVVEDYREGIQKNQLQLIIRLKKLAGPEKALKMIRDAVRANRKRRSKRKTTGNIKPRAASSAISVSSDLGGISESGQATSNTAGSPEPFRSKQTRVSWQSTVLIPDNRTIIHELAINKEYHIDVESTANSRDEIVQALSRSIRAEFQSGSGDAWWIVTMAENIREKLLRLVRPGQSLHTLISESINTEMVAEQVTLGSFSFHRFFSFMATLLPKLCAPVRDDEVKAFALDPSEDPVERLAKLHFVIDLLSLDNINFTLQQSAPMLIKESAGYENKCFLNVARDTQLCNTKKWWGRAKSKATDDAARRATDPVLSSAHELTSDKIYSQGLVDLALIVATPKLHDEDFPETLELDRKRIGQIRSDVLRMVTIGAILLTAKNLLKRDVRFEWKVEAGRMWPLAYERPATYLSIIDSCHIMPPNTKSHLSSTIERVVSEAKAKRISHPVTKVLLQKLRTHLLSRLGASSSEDRLRVANTASETLASSGLAEFTKEIAALVDVLMKVREADYAAHGKWYDEISATYTRHDTPTS